MSRGAAPGVTLGDVGGVVVAIARVGAGLLLLLKRDAIAVRLAA